MDMVEKTRRSLTVLRRCQEADREELNHWARRCSDTEDTKKGPSPATARPRSSSAGPEGSQLGVRRVGGEGADTGELSGRQCNETPGKQFHLRGRHLFHFVHKHCLVSQEPGAQGVRGAGG